MSGLRGGDRFSHGGRNACGAYTHPMCITDLHDYAPSIVHITELYLRIIHVVCYAEYRAQENISTGMIITWIASRLIMRPCRCHT